MPAPLKKSEATRARILEAALELFREGGFEQTTMRGIAARAGVATGAAYYYFKSKDAIVLAFYDQARQDMAPRLEEVLESTRDLKARLLGLVNVKFEYFAPSRRLLGALSGHTNPSSPLSPFSERTREIRESDIELFARALEGGRVKVARDLKAYMPRLLWLYQMGLILFWINDGSPGQRKSRALLERSAEIVVRLVRLAGLPLTRPLRKIVIELMDAVAPPAERGGST